MQAVCAHAYEGKGGPLNMQKVEAFAPPANNIAYGPASKPSAFHAYRRTHACPRRYVSPKTQGPRVAIIAKKQSHRTVALFFGSLMLPKQLHVRVTASIPVGSRDPRVRKGTGW